MNSNYIRMYFNQFTFLIFCALYCAYIQTSNCSKNSKSFYKRAFFSFERYGCFFMQSLSIGQLSWTESKVAGALIHEDDVFGGKQCGWRRNSNMLDI